MRRIVIELSRASIDNAVAELKAIKKEHKKKCDEVCRRLAEIGAQEAQMHLGGAHGNTDVTIAPIEKIGNGYKIVMSGSDVYFVEFGTGNQVDPHFSNVSVPIAWGTWSEQDKQLLYRHGFWWYGGEKLEGTPAYKPMYYAEKVIRANINRVVREVFG